METIQSAIEDLDATIGVKAAISPRPLIRLHDRRDYSGLCRAIGLHMGMPNAIQIAVASEKRRFAGHAISATDALGRGTHAIAAQVRIPSNLPAFGTVAFRTHEIEMLLHEEFERASWATAVALLSHELAHVLLHSLRHHERESERITDLVPIVLGFGGIVAQGRVVVSSDQVNGIDRTTTTTYGYLSNEEFRFARRFVRERLRARLSQTAALRRSIRRAEQRVSALSGQISDLSTALSELDICRELRRPADANVIVALHTPGHFEQLTSEVDQIWRQVKDVIRFSNGLNVPSARIAERIAKYREFLEGAAGRLLVLEAKVGSELRIVLHNQSILRRLLFAVREQRRRILLKLPTFSHRAV